MTRNCWRFAAAIFAVIGVASTGDAQTGSRLSIEKRLEALEKKTDYYRVSEDQFTIKYKEGDGQCPSEFIRVPFPGKINVIGTVHVWLTSRVKYHNSPKHVHISATKLVGFGSFGSGCFERRGVKDLPSGELVIEQFCLGTAVPGDLLGVILEVDRPQGPLGTCDFLTGVDVDVKARTIEILEPE